MTGNASIGMLMLAVAGLALPAALMLSDEMIMGNEEQEFIDKNYDGVSDINDGPTYSMLGFSRFNAIIMIVGYLLYLLFQLGSHKDEFEDLEEEEGEGTVAGINGDVEEGHLLQRSNPKRKKKARKNVFCHRLFRGSIPEDEEIGDSGRGAYRQIGRMASIREMEMSPRALENNENELRRSNSTPDYIRKTPGVGDQNKIPQSRSEDVGSRRNDNSMEDEDDTVHMSNMSNRRRVGLPTNRDEGTGSPSNRGALTLPPPTNGHRSSVSNKSHCSDGSQEEEHFTIDISRHSDEEESKLFFLCMTSSILILQY